MSPTASMMCQPNCVFTGSESSPVSSSNATLSNGATVAPFCAVNLPPSSAEAGSCENCLASLAKSPPFSSSWWIWSALALLLHEDVPDLARGRLLELRLVLLVVRLDVRVGDLDLARDLLEDLLGQHPRSQVLEHLLLGQALLLELLLVLRVVALEELLLELVEARLQLLVGHRDVELLGGDLELRLLDEAADERVAELRELGRPRCGELLLARLVRRLRLGQKPVVLGLRDGPVVDERRSRPPAPRADELSSSSPPPQPAAATPSASAAKRADESSPKRHGRAG